MEGDMDFQSLSRKELQALCKNNKIPANMTNAAMADALKSLQHVEGIEEFIKPAESETPESPEKLMSGSQQQDIPRTVCRTSTRRKPTNGVPQTPAVPSSRKRAPVVAASARQNTESLACSTRRSVRLTEKKLAQLSLNERGRTQPIKIDDLSKEMLQDLDDAQENNSLSGADTPEVSEEGSERTNDLEVVSDQNLNEAESARDSKDDLQENDVTECYDADTMCEVDPIPNNEMGEERFVLETIEHSSTMDSYPTPVKQMSPHPLVSNEELKGEIPFSNWAVDPSLGHIPRPRLNDLLSHSKEDIDNSGGEVELMEEEGKKNTATATDDDKTSTPLNNKSLRQLKGMVKSKLALASSMKNNHKQEERTALQALPENQD